MGTETEPDPAVVKQVAKKANVSEEIAERVIKAYHATGTGASSQKPAGRK